MLQLASPSHESSHDDKGESILKINNKSGQLEVTKGHESSQDDKGESILTINNKSGQSEVTKDQHKVNKRSMND